MYEPPPGLTSSSAGLGADEESLDAAPAARAAAARARFESIGVVVVTGVDAEGGEGRFAEGVSLVPDARLAADGARKCSSSLAFACNRNLTPGGYRISSKFMCLEGGRPGLAR